MYHYSSPPKSELDGSVLFPQMKDGLILPTDFKRQVSTSNDSFTTSGVSIPSINSNSINIKSEIDLTGCSEFSDEDYNNEVPKGRSSSFCGATQFSSLNHTTFNRSNLMWSRGLQNTGLFASYAEDRSLHIPIPCAEERAGPTMSAGGGGLTATSVTVGGNEPNPGTPTHLGAESSACRPYIPSPDDTLEDLTPVSRDRCNTWPLPRPSLDLNPQTSPLIHEQIPEEDNELYDSSDNVGRLGALSTASTGMVHSPENTMNFSPGMSSPIMNGVPASGASDTSDPGCTPGSKKSTTRRNAWGNLSYADLITQAILQSPEKRLTLSQVYEWMVLNVPYFRDKGDSNSSAGWKVR
ncbi:unnamed protein product [Auanema sp. JU1783]|nr:unnamed protein product [Auanema sp. JU1783]